MTSKYAFEDDSIQDIPVIHIISDSSGQTASDVVRAAMSQFAGEVVKVVRLSNARTMEVVRQHLDSFGKKHAPAAVFHTLVDYNLRSEVRSELDRRGVPSIDLLGPAVNIISTLTGEEPVNVAGRRSEDDERYHSRVTGMNFFAEHDEGLHPEDLSVADAVLFGVTRTSKTPLALYLGFLGYKVANITYTQGAELPQELFQVDPRRVFGLVPSSSTLDEMRNHQITDSAAFAFVGSTADTNGVDAERAEARQVMDKLGCTVIAVNGKTVEELAAEVLSRIKALTPDN